MLSIENYKYYIFILLITIILGYFMGITISTIVDYRLKDAVINLPKPKNKILVKLDEGKILETFSSSKKSKKKKKDLEKNSSKKKSDSKKKKKTDKKADKHSKKKKNKKEKRKKSDKFIETFTSKFVDLNLEKYANNFNEKKSVDKLHLKAANEEEDDQNYQKIA
tara:strand:- start:3209 stop:3703 length:495 start_codon:yes stop_codon:yes gene_type:complete